jgi:hypothetical protein
VDYTWGWRVADEQDDVRTLQEWAERVTTGQKDSAVFLSLWSDALLKPEDEPVPIFQLGYAMVLDKPIVIVAPEGSRIPTNVRRAARAV